LKKYLLVIIFVLIAVNVSAKDYVIGDGDSIQISVWGHGDLSMGVIVRPDGKITLPAIGEIRAYGLTPMELRAILQEEMKKVVKTPIVQVIMSGMGNYRVFIFGKGAPSGIRTLNRETTLLELLSGLGNLENADLQNSYLVRNKEIIKKDFYDLFEKGDFSQDIILESNDMLFFPDNFEKRITIVGAINQPTVVPYSEGQTLLDLLLSVGGFTDFAKENDVRILRKTDNGDRELIRVKAKDLMEGELENNIGVMPGDFIIVKERFF
jgi:polysaccharide export outer membrane protein